VDKSEVSNPNVPSDNGLSRAETEHRVRQVELLISTLLRAGVTISLLVVVIGTFISFTHHPDYVHSPEMLARVIGSKAEFPYTVRGVVTSALQGRGQGIVMLGLFLLIATPVMRVAVSVLAFVYERDRVFVAITTIVLLLLLLSFFLGKGGG
jgi:uncharacterized membrane protein